MPPAPKPTEAELEEAKRKRREFYHEFARIFQDRYNISLFRVQLYQPLCILRKILVVFPFSPRRIHHMFKKRLRKVYPSVANVLQLLNNGSFKGIRHAEFFNKGIRELLNWVYHAAQQVPSSWDAELDLSWVLLPDVRPLLFSGSLTDRYHP